MNIAIIPARAGSKRITNKNIRDFLGVPIIIRVISLLAESKCFDRIIVSTDSTEIAELVIRNGGEVPFMRPQHIADDFASTRDVILHAIQEIHLDNESDINICCVYPTSIMLKKEDLIKAFELNQLRAWNYVFAAYRPNSSPFRMFSRNFRDGCQMIFPQYYEFRSQDLPEAFADAGLFYIGSINTWKSDSYFFSPKSTFVEIPEKRAVDINEPEDWKLAEYYFLRQMEVKNE